MRPIHDTLDWNLLRSFMAIVQERSVSRAAARLHLSQPAVSLALKRLEERLGQSLIERGSRSFRVTKAGELVYNEAVEIYANVARLSVAVNESRPEVAGNIHLLMVSGIEIPFLDQVLKDFHQLHPYITCNIDVMSSIEVQQALLQKEGTVGICLMNHDVEGLQSQVLARQLYRFYCGHTHRFFGKDNLSLEDMRHEPQVSFSSAQLDGVLSPLAVFCANNQLSSDIVAQSSSLDDVKRMVRAGWGIGCLPEHTVANDVKLGKLWPLPPYDGVADIDMHLIWHRDARFGIAEQAFFDFCQNALARVPLEKRLLEQHHTP
ncbi:LysR family transcriptional regulator [Oceanimonas doudoroffii]|uniref:LysR family transcriptional regulator n=1 Tax=Oceanimonas doudoroffii TaxID=84158 RepID=A0A233RJ45_9GAMM|nr:LysR family transcriptional regulator [Oceanimonas doudoroffii]OXY83401.1 LysR family transcriptional regulator [Oceanimonas doudoroffii]